MEGSEVPVTLCGCDIMMVNIVNSRGFFGWP